MRDQADDVDCPNCGYMNKPFKLAEPPPALDAKQRCSSQSNEEAPVVFPPKRDSPRPRPVKARELLSNEIALARGVEPAEANAWIDEQLTRTG
jgi:hypothetical protein